MAAGLTPRCPTLRRIVPFEPPPPNPWACPRLGTSGCERVPCAERARGPGRAVRPSVRGAGRELRAAGAARRPGGPRARAARAEVVGAAAIRPGAAPCRGPGVAAAVGLRRQLGQASHRSRTGPPRVRAWGYAQDCTTSLRTTRERRGGRHLVEAWAPVHELPLLASLLSRLSPPSVSPPSPLSLPSPSSRQGCRCYGCYTALDNRNVVPYTIDSETPRRAAGATRHHTHQGDTMQKLTTAREINSACADAWNGRGGYVWADTPGAARCRITAARTRKGERQVRRLFDGKWTSCTAVYTD